MIGVVILGEFGAIICEFGLLVLAKFQEYKRIILFVIICPMIIISI